MNRLGAFTRGAPSKATASTLCQKCLKRDIYECKAVAQERPYVSRPSRTQQLLNPKLLPKLTSNVPQDLLRKKGIANEQLAKAKKELVLERERLKETKTAKNPNHSRPTSSSSSESVTTISTNASRSPRIRGGSEEPDQRLLASKTPMTTSERKRRRSISSDGSYLSDPELRQGDPDLASTRSTRRKIGEQSPQMRGRRRSRTGSEGRQASCSSNSRSPYQNRSGRGSERNQKLEAEPITGTYNATSHSSSRRRYTPGKDIKQPTFRDDGDSPSRRSHYKATRSHNAEEGRMEAAKSNLMGRPQDRSFSNDNPDRRYPDVVGRHGTSFRRYNHFPDTSPHERREIRSPQRKRSLSPFSKRLALTQAMNTGR